MAPSLRGRSAWWLAAATVSCVVAAPAARADAVSEVRIVQVQLGPDGSFTEIGTPLSVRSFSNGVAQSDTEFYNVPVSIVPGQTRSWDFTYTVSMRVDAQPFSSDVTFPTVCAPLHATACSPPIEGRSLAWSYFTIGYVDGRTMVPWAQWSGTETFSLELRDGTFERSGLVHLEAGSSSTFSGWSGGFTVGAMTIAAAIPEPATHAQIGIGLAVLAGALARRRRARVSAAPPPAA